MVEFLIFCVLRQSKNNKILSYITTPTFFALIIKALWSFYNFFFQVFSKIIKRTPSFILAIVLWVETLPLSYGYVLQMYHSYIQLMDHNFRTP